MIRRYSVDSYAVINKHVGVIHAAMLRADLEASVRIAAILRARALLRLSSSIAASGEGLLTRRWRRLSSRLMMLTPEEQVMRLAA